MQELVEHHGETMSSPRGVRIDEDDDDDDDDGEAIERLAEDERPQRQAFRYVLGLILIRKRLMRYVSSRQEGEGDQTQTWWQLRAKGSTPEDPLIEMLNPGLGDDDIIELSEQLGDVLQGDL